VENLVSEIRQHAWQNAYDTLANRAEFTEPEFVQDLTGSNLSLRTFATLDTSGSQRRSLGGQLAY
jgi:hypothetical protein